MKKILLLGLASSVGFYFGRGFQAAIYYYDMRSGGLI